MARFFTIAGRSFGVACLLATVSLASVAQTPMSAEDKFQALVNAGVFESDSGTGSISERIDRQQFAAIVSHIMGLESGGTTSSPFADLPSGEDWYSGYIAAATEVGTIEGTGTGSFDPAGDVTLEQLAALMVRALGNEETPAEGDVSDWAKAYVQAAVESGLLTSGKEYTEAANREDLVATLGLLDVLQGIKGDSVQETAGGNGAWSDFPLFAANELAPAAPTTAIGGDLTASYTGRVAGAFTDGTAVTGSVSMLFDFTQQLIHGGMVLDNAGPGSVMVIGGWSSNAISASVMGSAYGGTIHNGQMNGKFYGAQGQEVGGGWSFNIDNTRPASGQFAAKQQ